MESYLIRNGVDVFGDLVCMPHPERLREQGERFADGT